MTFLRNVFRFFLDCKRCGHSLAYHLPLVGCCKCDCPEFR